MSGFCVDDWHQTTEMDMQHRALGGKESLLFCAILIGMWNG